MSFDRGLALGKRLDIAAGTAVRFEPGEGKTVTLVPIGGHQIVSGGNNLFSKAFGNDMRALKAISSDMDQLRERFVRTVLENGFMHEPQRNIVPSAEIEPCEMSREAYAAIFGPTVGDSIGLGDTFLSVTIEKDYTTYGDECKFGGGKVLREGMGQATNRPDSDTLDLVITNAIIVDHSGIIKADIGIKKGFIVGIGKAGNPDVMDGVTEGMIVGANTEVIAGEKNIITAGAIDAHVHCECQDLIMSLVSLKGQSTDCTSLQHLFLRHLSSTVPRGSLIGHHDPCGRRVSVPPV